LTISHWLPNENPAIYPLRLKSGHRLPGSIERDQLLFDDREIGPRGSIRHCSRRRQRQAQRLDQHAQPERRRLLQIDPCRAHGALDAAIARASTPCRG